MHFSDTLSVQHNPALYCPRYCLVPLQTTLFSTISDPKMMNCLWKTCKTDGINMKAHLKSKSQPVKLQCPFSRKQAFAVPLVPIDGSSTISPSSMNFRTTKPIRKIASSAGQNITRPPGAPVIALLLKTVSTSELLGTPVIMFVFDRKGIHSEGLPISANWFHSLLESHQ